MERLEKTIVSILVFFIKLVETLSMIFDRVWNKLYNSRISNAIKEVIVYVFAPYPQFFYSDEVEKYFVNFNSNGSIETTDDYSYAFDLADINFIRKFFWHRKLNKLSDTKFRIRKILSLEWKTDMKFGKKGF